jgi:hypothetical protein
VEDIPMRHVHAARAALVCLVAACGTAPTQPPAAEAAARLHATAPSTISFGGDEVMFNPQPDPPRVLRFITSSLLASSPRGSLSACGGESALTVTPGTARTLGDATDLVQTWSFAASSCRRALTVVLRGTFDARTGTVRLAGTATDGTRVQVVGAVTSGLTSGFTIGISGPGSIAGEVAFDPQPDPPMPTRF